MVEIADIRDANSLERWLEDKPPQLAVLLELRATLRVAPRYWSWAATTSNKGELSNIQNWRILLNSQVFAANGVSATSVAPAINAAAESAGNASSHHLTLRVVRALAAASEVARAIDAVRAVSNAPYDRQATSNILNRADFWMETRRDATLFQATEMRAPVSLWSKNTPLKMAEAWDATRSALYAQTEAGETGWQFWIDWYEAQLSGAEQNWEMLKEIVLIPDDDWKQGAAHVNAMIEGIVGRYQGDGSLTLSGHAELRDVAGLDADHAPRHSLVQILNRNAKTIRLQLDTLASLLRDEIDVLRGRNDLSDEDCDEAQRRIEILNRILARVETMAGEFSEEEASESALTVVEQNLLALPDEAAQLAEEGGDPVVSDLVISMGASIEHLTKRGTPGTLATGIAAFDHLWGGVKDWWTKKRGGTP